MTSLIVIELADAVFAVDSVPAVLAITDDLYIAFTSNALALLGLRALFFVLARFPEAQGVLKFWIARLRHRRSVLIEYK